MVMALFNDFFRGRKVLITGHTGFKGSWLTLWLHRLGADITGISLLPQTQPNLFSLLNIESLCQHHVCDIRDQPALATLINKVKPEIVFHLAAQPLVRASYREPIETFSTNVMGTANLLEALRSSATVKSVVMVTTDKVYQNQEVERPYQEDDRLGGHDPYSASKAASELIIDCYRNSFLAEQGIALASARAGNVIGGGDWSDDRLIPDAIRAWQNKQPLNIRRPESIRPWQHVLEPLFGYMKLAHDLYHQPELSGAFNFGPETSEAATVRHVISTAQQIYSSGDVIWHDVPEGVHEAGLLTLDTTKSHGMLNIRSLWDLNETLKRTINWYSEHENGTTAQALCEADIAAYEALL
ncbi:CDP-glucose 4,6-dehydratase [Shewanella aestuarii]|uniref:CDP-glucose 4,6-dehydratase n=2 Tax=Shewanella aestuarii TaxID=1028752 RepID=A0A6G9QNE8_9GAMM|nr:CDP-glucose 4,6-dehydratase [Shewanella aestuarii]